VSADPTKLSAAAIAADVASGARSATAVVEACLRRITEFDRGLGAFTDVTAARARAKAAAIDADRVASRRLGPLAGVPFAAKNLFDIEGLPTRAGSKINRERPPATADATLIARLEAAGAILLGGLNMGEYAYDFTGENVHDGASRNAHDRGHMAGGSSGGSGAAVAAGLVPLSLGSDTNGSIRVPASLCGLFGLKPTYGRLSRAGTFPFVASLDHVGALARSAQDLALAYDVMQGLDPHDMAQVNRPIEPTSATLDLGTQGLRVAVASGYFAQGAEAEALAAVSKIAAALGASETIELPAAGRARAAAYVITTVEGASLHLDRLRERPQDFDPDVRDRLIAGAMIPGAWVVKAQKFRRWFREQILRLFEHVDVILAPATPCRAPKSGQKTMKLAGEEMLVRPNLGLFTQPISFIGLPVCAVPVWTQGERLPIGVQIIAPPWREDLVLRVAHALERDGIVAAPVATLGANDA
jgi:aspartyl-tRNA(Asn)/glutamyl-tRNA(Gln) amidotransferase subunit A